MIKNFYGDAATLPRTLGGGCHGNLGLIIRLVLYNTLSQTSKAVPKDMGATLFIPTGSTAL